MDSLLSELFDFTSSEWVLTDRELFVYDSNGNMTSYVWFAFDSLDMEILPYDKEIVTYNSNGQPTEIIWQIWDKESGQWLNWGRYELSYDEQGNLVRETISDWDPDGGQWWVGAQFDMTYDGSGMQVSETWSFWDEDAGDLVLTYKDEYLYEDGKLITWNEYAYEEGAWVLIFRTTYLYAEGKLTEELTEAYDSFSETWLDFGQIFYTYNEAGRLIIEEAWEFDWEQFMVVQSWQYEYTWDSNGNLIEQVDKSWDGAVVKGTDAWENAFKSEWMFNTEYTILDLLVPYWFLQNMDNMNFVNMPLSELAYIYLDGDWAFDFRQTAYWSDFGGSTGMADMQESVVQIYPVPASESLTFSWEDAYARLKLEIYDLTGKRVISRSVDNKETLAVEQLSGGIYLYKLSQDEALIYSGKLSIE
jgi:YD repeat-containing protein